MNKHLLVVSALLLGVALAGCASKAKKDDSAPPATTQEPAARDDTGIGRPIDAERRALEEAAKSRRIVYFDFDRAEIKSQDVPVIEAQARYLTANPNLRVRLEGHTDERGTREYNMGLGERRSNSVRDALLVRGVSARQLIVVSYGEERPVALGHNEEAWAQNRRVEFVYP
jgi:peptidoglycan-associated lipoprotein